MIGIAGEEVGEGIADSIHSSKFFVGVEMSLCVAMACAMSTRLW